MMKNVPKPSVRVNRVFLFYKPFSVVSQFSPSGSSPTLKDYGPFPPDVYPCGRLDADSEGLLVLTNVNELKHQLTDPSFGHPRTYWAQVERIPDEAALNRLREGVTIEGKKTRPAEACLLPDDPGIPDRPVPIRFRKNVPTCWIELTLREGRNRQVRKMTAAVGHPTLRLVRVKVGDWTLEGLHPGEYRELDASGFSPARALSEDPAGESVARRGPEARDMRRPRRRK